MADRREKGIIRTGWDSCFDFISQPRLGDRLWKDLDVLKHHPVIILVLVALTAILVHCADPWPRKQGVYGGETGVQLFFAGDGSQPTEVAKSNIYRIGAFEAHMM